MNDATDNPCPICGVPIPVRPRGSRHGHPPKTCSEACRKKRKRRLELLRYEKIKDTPRWREVRAEYVAKLKRKLAIDPEYASIFRAYAASKTREWRSRVDADPQKRAEILAHKRAHAAAWRAKLVSDPVVWEAHKTKCRNWYHSLSAEDRDRIYKAPLRNRGSE